MYIELLTTLHLTILAFVALVVLYSDHQGFLYFTGKKQMLSARFIERSHALVWAGLAGMIISGILIALPRWMFLLQEPAFYIKLGLVGVLLVNAFAISELSVHATEVPFKELPKEKQRVLIVSGALSGMGWIGAAIIGFFFL